tara:strand:- start:28 stop:984 length:957 start_codon:yes stop_codon:yes gene_type:complete
MERLLDNIEKCPVLVIYIIIQIIIQGYDIYKRNFIAAFMHFWLGFIFYISYKNTLCTEKDINLGIEKLLIVLVFVFCQIILLRISNTINRVRVKDISSKPKKKEEEEEGGDNNLIDYWNRNVGNTNLNSYMIMDIKPNMEENKIDTLLENIKNFNLSRGTELRLENGKIVSITGFEYKKSSEEVTLNLDKSINYNETYVYVKSKDLMGLINKNSNINDIMGSKEIQLKKRKEEIGKNISLLKDEIKKEIEKFKKSIKDKEEEIKLSLETEHKIHMDQLEYDLKKQQKIFDSMSSEEESIKKHRDKIIKEIEELREKMK